MSIVKKAGAVGVTATGAVIGAVVAGPVGAAMGGGVGALVDWWRHIRARKHPSKTVMVLTPGVTVPVAAPTGSWTPILVKTGMKAPGPGVYRWSVPWKGPPPPPKAGTMMQEAMKAAGWSDSSVFMPGVAFPSDWPDNDPSEMHAQMALATGAKLPRLPLVKEGAKLWYMPSAAPVPAPSPPSSRPLPDTHARAIAAAVPGVSPAAVQAAASTAPAATPPEATALYAYFQKYPYDRMLGDTFWKSVHTGYLVGAFQAVFNKAPESATLGAVPTNGLYDSKTAAALTLYTHDPVAADPKAG